MIQGEKKSCTVLFEHTAGGLAEHAAPVAAEWVRRGHRAILMATEAAMPGVRAAHENLGPPELVAFGLFGKDAIDWPEVDAIFNVIPGEPGPAFRDIHGRCDIPRITMNHGLTDKQTTFPAEYIGNGVGYANILFASGEAMFRGSWERYTRRWPEILDSLKIIPVGSPKTDVLFDRTYTRERVLASLGFDPGKPAVLYAPTYQREASLEQAGEAIINALAALPVNLIVRLHHLSMNTAWRARLKALEDRHANLRRVESGSNPLFVAADLLVGDASGASFEYILQDKPVVFFDVPDFFRMHGCDGVGYWGRKAGMIAHNTEELASMVLHELAHPEERRKERLALVGDLVHECGKASIRAVDAILDLLEGLRTYPTWGPRQCLRQDTLLHACLEERLERCALETRAIALFGAGAHTRWLLNFMRESSARGRRVPSIRWILDDQAKPPGHMIESIPVSSPEGIEPPEIDAVMLSTDYHQPLFRQRCMDVFGPGMPLIDLYEHFPWHRPGTVQ